MTLEHTASDRMAMTFDARMPDGTTFDVTATVFHAGRSVRAVALDSIRRRGDGGRQAAVPPPGQRRELFRLATSYANSELASADAATAAAPTVIEI